jgi:glycosyltransferase involved in cell wall biosynthesis
MVLVVSYQQPSYSEVWMERMTNMLRPDVEAAYVLRRNPNSVQTNSLRVRYLLPGFMSRFPSQLTARLGQRWIDKKMSQVLKSIDEYTTVLVHYVTMAVCIENAIFNCDNPVFVHCHGFDVTWGKRNERFPFLRDHHRSYVPRVLNLAKRVMFIANSRCTSEKLREIGVPDDRIVLKYIGVPVPSECPHKPDPSRDGVTILYLGRLTDFKGPVETIRAFAEARKLGLRGRLIFAGGGSQKFACDQEIL